jgi:hypothetical protein
MPFTMTPMSTWDCLDFYVEDADGYILCFSEQTARRP